MQLDPRQALVLLCGLALASLACAQELPDPGRPADSPTPSKAYDVLILAVDDLRDWVGALEPGAQAKTPNIDRLAARGMLFSRAYCPAPLCNPSRSALWHGVPPHVSGVYSNHQDWRPRLAEATSLPTYFRRHGYRTSGAGKLFHDAYHENSAFEEYFHGGASAQPPFAEQPLCGLKLAPHFDWAPIERGLGAFRDWRVAEWARAEVAKESANARFLAVGFYRPHLPWYVPPEYYEHFPLAQVRRPALKEDDLADIPPAGLALVEPEIHEQIVQAGKWELAIQAYLASIEFADHCVGRVLDALDASPRRERTIVVLWSDHGWHLGEKGHWRKSTLWEESARVPLIIVVPGLTAPGSVCEEAVSLMDLYPTLVELCALPARAEIAGRSLVPQLHNPAEPRSEAVLTTHGAGNHSLRTRRWCLIRYADGSRELYDQQADPKQWTNLASMAEYAECIAQLERQLPAAVAPDSGPDPKPAGKPAGDDGD